MNGKRFIDILAISMSIFIIVFCASVALAQASSSEVHISKGKHWDYYHIKFTLTPENTLLAWNGYDKYGASKYEFLESENYGAGCFEVFIPKDKFPISAPNCGKYIILRMPWTEKDKVSKNDYLKYVAEKKSIFDRIKKMKESGRGQVEAVIQLNNSYSDIKIKSETPLALELSNCNCWFRDAYGRYIDYVGRLNE